MVSVKVTNNGIGRKGGEALVGSLAYSQTIVDFDISSLDGLHRNMIGPPGVAPLAEILRFNKFLTFLDVSGNTIANEGLASICTGLEGNESIKVLKVS